MAAAAEKVDKKKEAQELKVLMAKARDPSATVSFGVSLGKGKEELAFMAHRKKASKVLRKEAKAKTGSNKCTMGRLKLDGKVLTLDCLEEPPSKLKRLLKLYFKDRNLPYKVAIALNGKTVDGEGDDDDDEDEAVAAGGGNAEAGAGAETGAEAMDDDFLDDIMGAVADETGATQDEVEAAMDDDMLDDIAAAVEEAGGQEQAPAAEDFLDDDMFDDIAAATTDENAAGGDAGAEEQPGAAAQKQSAEAEKVEKAIDNRKAFKKAREIWIKARNQVITDLQTIKTGAYNKYMDDVEQFPVVRKGVAELEEIAKELSEDLPKTLNAYVSTPLRDTAKMEALADEAKAMIARYKKFADSNKLVAAIDQKEFADCTIKAPLKKALNDLERAIV